VEEVVRVSDVLGYVVVEWNQAGGPRNVDGELYDVDELAFALDAVRMLRADGSGRYTVHAVMAEEIEEGT
jgi:predicted RNA-binding protein associated with RNAse of E/G family